MTRLAELNETLRRQSSRAKWTPALATPSGALSECLRRTDLPGPSSNGVPRQDRRLSGGRGLLAALAGPAMRRIRHNRTVRALERLDARTLADIGVERGEIEALAAKLSGRKAPAAHVRFAPLAALRRAQRRHAAIAQLRGLPDRTLSDIGIERGRIPAAVDQLLAEESAKAAARGLETVRGVAAPWAGSGRSEAAVETTRVKAA